MLDLDKKVKNGFNGTDLEWDKICYRYVVDSWLMTHVLLLQDIFLFFPNCLVLRLFLKASWVYEQLCS